MAPVIFELTDDKVVPSYGSDYGCTSFTTLLAKRLSSFSKTPRSCNTSEVFQICKNLRRFFRPGKTLKSPSKGCKDVPAQQAGEPFFLSECHWLCNLLNHCPWEMKHSLHLSTEPRGEGTTAYSSFLCHIGLFIHRCPCSSKFRVCRQTAAARAPQKVFLRVVGHDGNNTDIYG
jgi:hypothetical protein